MNKKTNKITTVVEGRRMGNEIARWAKGKYDGVEDTEVLCYAEDGRIQVAVRLYGRVESNHQTEVMKKMQENGLDDVETVIGLDDDNYITFYGYGSNTSYLQKVDRVRIILGGISMPDKCTATISDIQAARSLTMMWIKSKKKDRGEAAVDVYTAEKAIRQALRGVAKIRQAETYRDGRAYWMYM